MVPQSFVHASNQASVHNKLSEAISRSIRETPPLSAEQYSYTSGLQGFRVELSYRGIFQEITKPITKSRRANALENY